MPLVRLIGLVFDRRNSYSLRHPGTRDELGRDFGPCRYADINDYTSSSTAILHVILGHVMNLDVTSVHDANSGKFLRFSAVALAYGSAADGALEAERNRWMGPWRYFVAGARVVQRHR